MTQWEYVTDGSGRLVDQWVNTKTWKSGRTRWQRQVLKISFRSGRTKWFDTGREKILNTKGNHVASRGFFID